MSIYSKGEVNRLAIIISFQSEIPAYEQIKTQIKAQILSGELSADEPLTSIRQLARDLRVSVITTTRAYGDLEAEGLIYTVQGRGCFVKDNTDLVRTQYLQAIDEALQTAAAKGRAAGVRLAELQNKLEVYYNDESK
jgi:GntR family transcriptional regulator